jgi:hypothetical protein
VLEFLADLLGGGVGANEKTVAAATVVTPINETG